jgi:hypothetical protein
VSAGFQSNLADVSYDGAKGARAADVERAVRRGSQTGPTYAAILL